MEFEVVDFSKIKTKEKFDYSVAMFSLHSMNKSSREKILENMEKISKKQIIVDYNWPKNLFHRFLISTDEFLAGHLRNFLDYKNERIILNPQISERFYFIGFLINKNLRID